MLAEKLLDLTLILRQSGNPSDESDINNLYLKTLYIISKNGETSPAEIMFKLKLLKPNLTVITRTLAEKGLIYREVNAMDRRNIYFSITEKGGEFLQSALDAAEKNIASKMSLTDCGELENVLGQACDLIKF